MKKLRDILMVGAMVPALLIGQTAAYAQPAPDPTQVPRKAGPAKPAQAKPGAPAAARPQAPAAARPQAPAAAARSQAPAVARPQAPAAARPQAPAAVRPQAPVGAAKPVQAGKPRPGPQPGTPAAGAPVAPRPGLAAPGRPMPPAAGAPVAPRPGLAAPVRPVPPAAGAPVAPKPGLAAPVRPVPPAAGQMPGKPRPGVPVVSPGAGKPGLVAPAAPGAPAAPLVQRPAPPVVAPMAPAAPAIAPAPIGVAPPGGVRPPIVGVPVQPVQPVAPPVRRESGGIGPAGAAAIGLGVGLVGGYVLSNQMRGVSDVQSRRETVVEGGVTYVREPGRVIVREQGGPAFIRHDESERFAILGYKTRQEREGTTIRTIYDRPDGVRIVTVTDGDGRLLRRIRRYPDGREVIIIDNSFRPPPRRIVEQVVVMPPPPLTIPRERYIVDAARSDEATIYETLSAPPLAPIKRRYTVDEVRYSPDLRAQMRSVDVNTITFDSGSWDIGEGQAARLATIAAAINKAIQANGEEVFLVEGHTDAVGNSDDNLSLSDRRAQSVAEVLTKDFNVPAENLLTQGYGETQLRVQTDGAARENRRVTVRRITPLLAGNGQAQ